ncbi:MAG TPA: glycosyltransferase [Acidimicrobiales bacterium]|nr:glycosyltransferase [Acidimicrobiales bacterium]
MVALRDVDVPVLPLDRFRPLVGEERYADLQATARLTREAVRGRTVWTLNSTAAGGGVAEMLRVLVGYGLGTGLHVRWQAISGDEPFYAITKRIHNRIHGSPGDEGGLGPAEANHYRSVSEENATAFLGEARPGDVAILHDPQTAGMSRPLAEAGVHVVWRCHIGADLSNRWTEEAWRFLLPELRAAQAFVFSRQAYVPAELSTARVSVIPPSIDPFSPKNYDMSSEAVAAVLQAIGVLGGPPDVPATFARFDGTQGTVARRATIIGEDHGLDPSQPLVVQVSRWDRLKDMAGVMAGFAEGVAERSDAHLVLVGPAVDGVADDPEGAEVLAECASAWHRLRRQQRRAISLVTLPMDDVDENAAMVNALQRQATVIVQKSLFEGFGLTVSEGMWKAKPVVASAVGGIVDQIAAGTGVLLDDPTDLEQFADVLVDLLRRPEDAIGIGDRARRHVIHHFLGDRHLLQLARLIGELLD